MLREDYDLTREDIQLLSNRDALTAFFAKLGYDTNARLVQNAAAMGFSSDNLRPAIAHIERLASQDARMFEVYLFELKAVTVTITQAIVRGFRNRPGDYLLVLTDNYERLDFVLVERYSAGSARTQAITNSIGPLTSAPKQVGVRPRVLTVNRRKPGEVDLRVLRRFSYTGADTLAQYDKLLSAYDVADWSEPFFNNRALFSDYYLTRRLPESDEWRDPTEAAAMTQAFKRLRELYAGVREEFSNQPAAVVQAKLLEPVLTILGFTVQPSRASKHSDEVQADYKLYTSPGQPAPGLLALCLAYGWGRSLDGKDEQRDSQRPDENPGAAVVTLLDSGEAGWAIVTNGKTWRLYAAKAHSRATNYYEIDLEETLAQAPANREYAFRYFWLFFRAAAFIPAEQTVEGEKRQMCFLDSLLNQSERYARELGERLKNRVFEEIFPHFARGFIIYARRTGLLPPLDHLEVEERGRLLEPFFSGTLTFLYRLLFLLYAESRALLPVGEVRGYYEKSLERLKDRISRQAGSIESEAPAKIEAACKELSTAFYDELQELFQVVDRGDAALNVPVYNGGLFMTGPDAADTSPEAAVARFLSTHKIPDRQLALGLDRMARDLDEKRHDLVFIDYKSLGVRQLGSIYEGLLEFKLRIAPEVMAVVKGKKTEEIVPYVEAQQKKLLIAKEGRGKDASAKTYPKGKVYLENDRRERKASGSYYTPDYIVKYIVEHTVGPVLKEKLEALRPAFRDAEKTLKAERDKVKALGRADVSPEHETYKKYVKIINETFFDLKVLDPAMGSGHFLVEAVDYITDQMAKFLTAFRWNPVVYELAKTRREIQEEMERQGVTIDMSKLTDINLLKRHVLKSCIYGVDLNPMAVELAKVSLWLDCFTLGAPLSFLDHHMKCGNSLIGGSVQEVQDALSRDLFGHQFTDLLNATQLMRRVGELSDVTAQEVAESRKAYKGAYDALAPFKRLLDVWISEYFGNKKARITTSVYAGAIVAGNYSKANEEDRKAIETALVLAKDKHFFHWDLEFPEVFYDETKRKENGGFDAVVGNPPYVDLKGMEPILVDYYFQAFSSAENRLNIFAFFAEQAIKLVRDHYGFIGLIIPTVLLVQESYQRIRKVILRSTSISDIVRLPSELFGEAAGQVKVDTMILCLKRGYQPDNLSNVLIYTGFNRIDNISLTTTSSHFGVNQSIWLNNQANVISLTVGSIEEGILQRLKKVSTDLETLCEFCLGLTPYDKYTGHTEEQIKNRVFHSNQRLGDTYKRLLASGDVDRYVIEWGGEEWINYGEWLAAPREPRFFRDKHILVNQIVDWTTRRIKAGITDEELYNTQNAFNLLPSSSVCLEYIITLLNSALMNFAHEKMFLDEAKMRFQKVLIKDARKFPIRRITFTLSSEQRAHYLEKARNLYIYCLDKNDQACVTGFVEHHLSKQPEESDVVHDLLAFLAEEMIRLNKEKREAQKEFLGWLITTLKILPDRDGRKGIEVLTGKSKITDYPGDYQKGESPLAFEELLDILLRNKGRLGVSLSDGGLVERIKTRYEESLGRVLPVKERLAKTDALIDAVVYRLYGLTEEEIGVVEGKA